MKVRLNQRRDVPRAFDASGPPYTSSSLVFAVSHQEHQLTVASLPQQFLFGMSVCVGRGGGGGGGRRGGAVGTELKGRTFNHS